MYYFGYVRVSTLKQLQQGVSLEAQKKEIQEYADKNNFNIIFKEEAGRSAKRGNLRPVYKEMFEIALQDENCAGIIAYSISRFGRSVIQLISDIENLEAKNKKLILLKENFIDRSSPSGRLIFNVLASYSQFEIENLRERLSDGYEAYRLYKGKVGRKKMKLLNKEQIIEEYKQGQSIAYLSKKCQFKNENSSIIKTGISKMTLIAILKAENVYKTKYETASS